MPIEKESYVTVKIEAELDAVDAARLGLKHGDSAKLNRDINDTFRLEPDNTYYTEDDSVLDYLDGVIDNINGSIELTSMSKKTEARLAANRGKVSVTCEECGCHEKESPLGYYPKDLIDEDTMMQVLCNGCWDKHRESDNLKIAIFRDIAHFHEILEGWTSLEGKKVTHRVLDDARGKYTVLVKFA